MTHYEKYLLWYHQPINVMQIWREVWIPNFAPISADFDGGDENSGWSMIFLILERSHFSMIEWEVPSRLSFYNFYSRWHLQESKELKNIHSKFSYKPKKRLYAYINVKYFSASPYRLITSCQSSGSAFCHSGLLDPRDDPSIKSIIIGLINKGPKLVLEI